MAPDLATTSGRRGSLAILTGALGDSILAVPALAALARAAPPLTLWGPEVERLGLLVAPRGPAAFARRWPGACAALWGEGPLPEPLRAAFAGSRRLVGFFGPGRAAERLAAVGGASVAPPVHEPAAAVGDGEGVEAAGAGGDEGRGGGHAGDVLARRFLSATGLVAEGSPRLTAAPGDAARGRALAGGAEYVVCHVGSGGRAKRWRAAGWAGVLAGAGCPAVIVTGPVEEEWGVEGLQSLARAHRLLGPLPADELAALIAGARAFLGNDSGPTHLAAALGVPVVAVFGPTDPARWGPRGRGPIAVVRGDLATLGSEPVLEALGRVM